ncbi:MAG: contractile injection system tape measure protein [Dysgonomonas sp.]|uniref:contractile injection system tape measure protein n=1 Tax=Dysgonomonas sp. TaxID=1891233 RepID=UPI003A8875E4
MNTIGTIAFDFRMENEAFARSLYAGWDTFFAVNFEKIADRLLVKYDVKDTVVHINKLNIDLGSIEEDKFEEYFPRILEERMEEALIQMLHNPRQTEVSSQAEKDYLFDILCKFLLHGSLAWNIENKYRDINHLFLTVLRNEGKRLKAFLQTYGHYTSLQERLVYQLNDPGLEQGVRLLAPGESVFICSYINLLKVKYRVLENPVLHESGHRNAVWLVVYAYLLTNRSSYFNKKSFIISTIVQLAARFILSYDYLLTVIVSGLDTSETKQSMPSGLFLILDQLRKELSEKNIEKLLTDTGRLYRLVSSELYNNGENVLSEDTLNILLVTLTNPESCRRFLQQMKEDQILGLVPVVVPGNSRFVISYAQSLDRQHEHGALQGRAGSEFRLLKWQIIFPVLLENRGVLFNRKYFVRDVLSRVAAHYNVEISDILKYICSYIGELAFDSTLNTIFQDLLTEYLTGENGNEIFSSKGSAIWSVSDIIKSRELANVMDVTDLISQLSDIGNRRKAAEMLSEEQHHYLVSLIIPAESHFVIPYTVMLDKQRNNNILEGRAGSGFSKIKWEFIYDVLLASRNQVFNKKYFVDRTLNKIAAHYNVTVQDLLNYFYQEKMLENISLPYDLVRVFNELKIDYKLNIPDNHKKRIKNRKDAEFLESRKVLELYFGSDITYKELLNELAGQYDFVIFIRRALHTIQTLLHYLESELNISVDRKGVIRYLIDISERKVSLNLEEIVTHIINLLIRKLPKSEQVRFIRKIGSLAFTDNLLTEQSELINYKNDIMEKNDLIDVNNAGVVILAPYLPRLFSMLSLTEKGDFRDEDARLKAVFLLHYAVWEKEEAGELELPVNKLFAGMETGDSIPQKIELSSPEKETVASMLNGVLQNWGKLKNSSPMTLREAFLRRNGRLEEKEDSYYLTVEEKAYDMLLDSIPWNFRMIRMPWMKKPVIVKWR